MLIVIDLQVFSETIVVKVNVIVYVISFVVVPGYFKRQSRVLQRLASNIIRWNQESLNKTDSCLYEARPYPACCRPLEKDDGPPQKKKDIFLQASFTFSSINPLPSLLCKPTQPIPDFSPPTPWKKITTFLSLQICIHTHT